jgi:thiamine biosynthesis lipoprotein
MWSIRFRAMGTKMTAFLEPLNGAGPEDLDRVQDWFQEWEARLSRFIETSELSRLNNSHGLPVPVSHLLWDLLLKAIEISKQTEGLITPLVLNALQSAGYTESFDDNGIRDYSDHYQAVPTIETIRFNHSNQTVVLPTNERVDLGGFVKGWAADTAVERLERFGCVLIDAGGDISVNRPRVNGEPWLIGIENPFTVEEDIAILEIMSGGVATSGKNRRRWGTSTNRYQHHLIDPRTGSPAETDVLTATVVAPSASEAEIGAKVVFLLGSTMGLQWVESKSDIETIIITEGGDIYSSSQMKEIIRRN